MPLFFDEGGSPSSFSLSCSACRLGDMDLPLRSDGEEDELRGGEEAWFLPYAEEGISSNEGEERVY